MAVSTRGLGLACSRPLFASPRALLPQLSHSPSRCFSTALLLRSAAKTKAATPIKPSRPPPPSHRSLNPGSKSSSPATAVPGAPTRYAFVKSLASKSTPTLLYEAPSHFWFYFGCWSSGVTIISWTLLTGPTVISQPEGIPQWVGLVFGASYALLGSMGFYIISKTPNIVGSIRLLPPVQAATQGATATAAPLRAGAATAQIEVKIKRMFPLLEPKVLTTPLDKVILKTRLSLPSEFVPELQRLERQRAEEALARAVWKFDMEHLLTMPFRRIGRAVVGFFRGVRAAWTDMGYGIIKVDGKEYKVDVTKGFAHDGFRTLEKIVSIEGK